jgi:hypothetical protein
MAELGRLTEDEVQLLIEAARRKIEEINNARTKELLPLIKKAVRSAEAQQSRPHKRGGWKWFWLLVVAPVAAAIGIYCGLEWKCPLLVDTPRLGELHYQVAVLAFVVALAAYLANVSRDITKVLSALPVIRDTLAERIKMRKNLSLLTAVEINLVVHAVVTSVRLAAGEYLEIWSDFTARVDNFILIYLAMIIFGLASLHVRQWLGSNSDPHHTGSLGKLSVLGLASRP